MASRFPFVQRLWRPHHPLFWPMVGLQVLSSLMTGALHLWQPEGAWRVLLTVLALTNSLAGWWLLARLWRDTAPKTGETHVQGPADQQKR